MNIELGRQIAKAAAKSKEWCERNNVKFPGPEELEEYEDFSSEDDESDPDDIEEVKLGARATSALIFDSEVAMKEERQDSDDESVYFSCRSHFSASESEDGECEQVQKIKSDSGRMNNIITKIGQRGLLSTVDEATSGPMLTRRP